MEKQQSRAAYATILVVVLSLVGKVMGFGREMLIGHYFGAGMENDAFVAALRATSLLSLPISNSIATTFIPMLSRAGEEEGPSSRNYHTNNMMTLASVLALVVVIIGIIAAPLIVWIIAGDFDQATFDLTVQLTRIGMPVIVFSTIVGVMTGFLQYEGRFAAAGAIAIPLNIVYIGYLLLLSDKYGIYGLSVASVLGIAAQILFLYPSTKKENLEYRPVFNPKDRYVQSAIVLAIPVLISVAINDVNITVNTRLASGLGQGNVSWLNFANKLNVFVLGVFVSAITAVVFPILSRAFSAGDMETGKNAIGVSVRSIILITIPSMVGLIVLSEPIVDFAFKSGEFTDYDVVMTASALRFYALSLCAQSINNLLNRVYYSLEDTTTPLKLSALSVGLNIFFNLILVNFMGHNGLALGLSLAFNIMILVSFMILRKKLGGIGGKSYLATLVKALLASGVMGYAARFVYDNLIVYNPAWALGRIKIIPLMAAILVALVVYFVMCLILGVDELKLMKDQFKSLRKKD